MTVFAARPAGFACLTGARRGLVRSARALAGAALLALTGALVLPVTVEAQSRYTYTSNLSEDTDHYHLILANRSKAQGFHTGNRSDGYKLDSVQIRIQKPTNSTRGMRVRLYDESGGGPGNSIFEFVARDIPTGTNNVRFYAPGGARLDPDTDYFIVFETQGVTGDNLRAAITTDHDQQEFSDWWIHNERHYVDTDTVSNDWVEDDTRIYQISVRGYDAEDRPRVRAIGSAEAPSGGAYQAGDEIAVNVRFNESVDVTGTPRLPLTIGDETRYADYSSTNGAILTFSYTVQVFDYDADGFHVEDSSLELNGGAIKRANTNRNADLDHPALAADPDYAVDARADAPDAPMGLTATARGATIVDLAWTAPAADGGSAITGYRIEVSDDGSTGGWNELVDDTGSADTEYSHAGLFAGQTQHYRVSAINAAGTSDASDSRSATTSTTCIRYTGDIWCGLVTVADLRANDYGYIEAISAGGLSEEDFRVGPEKYTIDAVFAKGSGALSLSLTSALTDDHRARLELYIQGESDAFPFSTAMYFSGTHVYRWEGRGLEWQPGSTVALRLWFSNSAPVFAETALTLTVPENSAAGAAVGAPLTATDADSGDTLAYSLEGPDAASFTIDETSGQVRTGTGVTYNYEAPKNSYSVTVKADDGNGRADTIDVTINVADDDTEAPGAPDAPHVSAASVSSLRVSWAAPANDGPPITDYDYRHRRTSPPGAWTPVTGTTITGLSATIQGLAENTSYDVQVRATNAEGTGEWSASGRAAPDANAAPAFTSPATFEVVENRTVVGAVRAADSNAEDAVSGYTITGGADHGFFSIGFASGTLAFDAALNYEDAQDRDADNRYEVTVQASSGAGEREKTATQTITVTVTDDNTEAPGAPAAPDVSAALMSSLDVSWAAPANAGPPITDYDYRYRTASSQGAWTEVTGTTITGLSATIRDLAENTSYDVQVRATNAEGAGAWSASGRGATFSASGCALNPGDTWCGSSRLGIPRLPVARLMDSWLPQASIPRWATCPVRLSCTE